MFAIKSRNQKYLQIDEDDSTITLNLVPSHKAATKFASQEEARSKVKEIVSNAEGEVSYLSKLETNEAVSLEIESIESQYYTLTVTEIK